MRGTMSILGLWEFDNDILENLVYPEELDGDLLKGNIILECAELETIYPDPDFFKAAVGGWSNAQLPTWEKLMHDFSIAYNPLENYDRTETWTDSGSENTTTNNNTTQNGTYTDTGEKTHSSRAYNDDTLLANDKDDTSGSGSNSNTVTGSGTQGTTKANNRTGHVHGNIGIRSAQELLEQSINLEPKTNMYNYIIQAFKNRFCLLVY